MNVGVLKCECVSWLLGHLSLSVSNLWRESQRWEQSSGALPQWRCEAAVSAFPYCTFPNQNWVLTSIWNLYFTNGCALQHCSVTFVFRASLAVLHMGAVVCLAVPICCWHRRCHTHDSWWQHAVSWGGRTLFRQEELVEFPSQKPWPCGSGHGETYSRIVQHRYRQTDAGGACMQSKKGPCAHACELQRGTHLSTWE